MANLVSIQERTWELFLRPSPPRRAVFAVHARALQAKVHSVDFRGPICGQCSSQLPIG